VVHVTLVAIPICAIMVKVAPVGTDVGPVLPMSAMSRPEHLHRISQGGGWSAEAARLSHPALTILSNLCMIANS
jgi:hypothetical protein